MDRDELNDAERRQIAREAANEAVKQTFESLGIDISTPTARQQVRYTWAWLQAIQTFSSKAGGAAVWVVVSLVITGMAYAFWEGLRHFIKGS